MNPRIMMENAAIVSQGALRCLLCDCMSRLESVTAF
jgi:hypothetical protein